MIDAYKNLEFDVILKQIEAYASFSKGKEAVMNLQPSANRLLVQRQLDLVKEVEMINLAENYELGGISDVSFSLEKASKDMILTGLELLRLVI